MSVRRRIHFLFSAGVFATIAFASTALAQTENGTTLPLPAVNSHQVRLDDENRVKSGSVPHYAAILKVEADPWRFGEWQPGKKGRARWQLDIHSPGALSLSLAFTRFELPPGAVLWIRGGPDEREVAGPFTRADHDRHGQLWTPPMAGDRLHLELDAPIKALGQIELRLTRVHHGYAGFGEADAQKAGGCHLDPACLDEIWDHESRSVALLSIEGVRYCTGFLLNNTAQDGAPFLATARHCGITARNAASVVAMWRHERASCDGDVESASRIFQSGAEWRANHRAADITLLELDDPPPPAAQVVFAGWDRAEELPREATAIHHPNTGRKRIAFADGPLLLTHHLGGQETAGGDHLRVGQWRQGTTEGGSSGAPLFNEDRRVVGVLHGGYAACGNKEADWFGRLAAAWHGPSPSHRLRDWLDPLDLQPLVLDARALGAAK